MKELYIQYEQITCKNKRLNYIYKYVTWNNTFVNYIYKELSFHQATTNLNPVKVFLFFYLNFLTRNSFRLLMNTLFCSNCLNSIFILLFFCFNIQWSITWINLKILIYYIIYWIYQNFFDILSKLVFFL